VAAIPQTPLDIGPRWLEKILAASFPGTEVESVQVDASSEGTNANALLKVTYTHASKAPQSIFAKLPPTEAHQRALVLGSGMGQREVLFYRHLADRTPLRTPQVWGTALEESDGSFAILIEDLCTSGYSFPDGAAGVGLSLAERAMEDLAAFHCTNYENDALAFVLPPLRDPAYAGRMLKHALATKPHQLESAFASVARIYIGNGEAVHDLWEAGDTVVTHGDGHLGNLYVEGDRLGFFDWGCFARAPAMRDIGYFLCMALSIDDRRRHERELIRRYLEQCRRLGSPALSFDAAFEAHRLQASYCVVAAAPAVLNPRAPGDPNGVYAGHFVARASAAVKDLEVEALLRAKLDL